MTEPLYLIRFALDRKGLGRALVNQPWFGQTDDLGQEVHAASRALFHDLAPKPFHIDKVRRDGTIEVLAYSAVPASDLRDAAQQFADPAFDAAVQWEHLASKQMPHNWSEGTRVGFHTRCCPVVRNSSGDRHGSREEDAFLSRKRQNPDITREDAYSAWVASEFERRGGQTLESVRVSSHRRTHLLRRTQRRGGTNRRHRVMERPIATFEGVLVVTETDTFSALLARGLGRHRSFGFGMLLLRPPPTC